MRGRTLRPAGRRLLVLSSSNSSKERENQNHDYENRRQDIAPNQTLHQGGTRSRLRGMERSSSTKRMGGPRVRSYPQWGRRRASRWQVSVGPNEPARRGNERVWRVPGVDSGREDCLHLEMG